MSLSAIIAAAQDTTVSDDQGPWRQFILDHLIYIKKYKDASNPTAYATITPEIMNLYRYDLARYLKEQMQRFQDIAWIVKLLNNIKSDLEFVEPRSLYVPTDGLILKLYHLYTTSSQS